MLPPNRRELLEGRSGREGAAGGTPRRTVVPVSRPHHRPTQKSAAFFEAVEGGTDPAIVTEAAERAAALLVRGARESEDDAVADRLLHLADTEGIEAIAEVWSGAPADTLAGCLWRLYLLRQWVHADPVRVSRAFEEGRARAQVARNRAKEAITELAQATLRIEAEAHKAYWSYDVASAEATS